VNFLAGEDMVSAGSGRGVVAWPERAIPGPSSVDWSRVHDIPIALVTGSNGKTTVVRLLAAMAGEAGRISGSTTTDGVAIQGRFLAEGDFSGPSGARMLLRRPEVETAILETARGGLLRRGLTVERAAAAVITNIAADHLGEFGVDDLPALAETKLLVARALQPGGRLVLNADDPVLVEAAARVTVPIAWFSLDPANSLVRRHVAAGGVAAVLRDDGPALLEAGRARAIAPAAELPIALGGAARYNLANALAALAAAGALGIPDSAARAALARFGRDPEDNPGRANLIELGGARLFLDYVHNPHGMAALAAALDRVAARRRLVMLGQAGDRDDESIRTLARAALALRPDRVVVKEMDAYLRGRAPGEVPGIIAGELRRAGLPPEAVTVAASEPAGVRSALAWALPGDLLVLAVHQDRRGVLDLVDSLRKSGWRAGDPVPDLD
jgi:cyanophycin synthetase